MKEFKGLLRSEVKKIETAANKATGFDNCKLTAYSSSISRPFDFDPTTVFVDICCEICRDYKEPVEGLTVTMSVPMFDRRKSKAYAIYVA